MGISRHINTFYIERVSLNIQRPTFYLAISGQMKDLFKSWSEEERLGRL